MNYFRSSKSLKTITKKLVQPIARTNSLSWPAMILVSALFIVSYIMVLQSQVVPKQNIESMDAGSLARMKSSELSNEKLRQEILKLRSERQQIDDTVRQNISSYGPSITALVGFSSFVFTIWKTSHDNIRQRELDRQQQKQEQEKRELDNLRRLNEQLKDLSAEQAVVRVSAAVSLRSFLHPGSVFLNENIYWILSSALTNKQDKKVYPFLVEAFEKAINLHLEHALNENRILEIYLRNAYLRKINLAKLNLSQTNLIDNNRKAPSHIDLASADLQGANLADSKLQRMIGMGVDLSKAYLPRAKLQQARLQRANLEYANLHGAYLIAADLKYANLRGAQFQGAHLQSAHFNKTDIRDAVFERANLADAYFLELHLQNHDSFNDTLRSILKARNWEQAHYNKKIWNRLIDYFLEFNPSPNKNWDKIIESCNYGKIHNGDARKRIKFLFKNINSSREMLHD
jgi:uncharacterized protein YjbI with pentapeptide repeats